MWAWVSTTASMPRGIDRQRRPVAQAQLLETLKQAAIDQNRGVCRLDQIFRPGDGADPAEKGHLYAHTALRIHRPPPEGGRYAGSSHS